MKKITFKSKEEMRKWLEANEGSILKEVNSDFSYWYDKSWIYNGESPYRTYRNNIPEGTAIRNNWNFYAETYTISLNNKEFIIEAKDALNKLIKELPNFDVDALNQIINTVSEFTGE